MALPFKLLKKTLQKCSEHFLFVLKNLWNAELTGLIFDKITQTTNLLIKFAKLDSLLTFFCLFDNIQRSLIAWTFWRLRGNFCGVILSSVLVDLSCNPVDDWRVVNYLELFWMRLTPVWNELFLINRIVLRKEEFYQKWGLVFFH